MITLDLSNLVKIDSKHGLSEMELNSQDDKLNDFLEKIHERKQGFYQMIDDKEVIISINQYAEKVEGKFEHVVVLGIGGSALGTICLQKSLKHLFENELKSSPHLHVLDNIDPDLISSIEDVIDYSKTLFIVVSKSGETMETLTQYSYFRKKLEKNNLDLKNHLVFITDPKKGTLREIANKEGITCFDVPENVGGRFSVLSPVGLLPAKLIGIDIEKLMEGAIEMRDKFLNTEPKENPSFKLATVQFLLSQKEKFITVLMPYSQRLTRLADWYRQLLAESIGKEGKGLTPVNALGATDQHSQNQLYNDGPNDKLIIFIEVENFKHEVTIPNSHPETEKWKILDKNVSFNKFIQLSKTGTEQSLTKNNRPSITIKIDEVNARTLGELFMIFEGSIAFLGEFYKINAFDQPGVELSKKITKELLINEYEL